MKRTKIPIPSYRAADFTPLEIAERWLQRGRREEQFSVFAVGNLAGAANGYNDDEVMPRASKAVARLVRLGYVVRVRRGWYRWVKMRKVLR